MVLISAFPHLVVGTVTPGRNQNHDIVTVRFFRHGKTSQIQENLVAYMRLFARLPGMVMVDDAQSFWFVSNKFVSNKTAPGNMVLRTRWSKERINEQINVMFTQIGSHIDQIDWMVFPGDQPPDLGSRLEARDAGREGRQLAMGRSDFSGCRSVQQLRFHIEIAKNVYEKLGYVNADFGLRDHSWQKSK